MVVSDTAAVVARQGLLHLAQSGRRVLVEQGLRAHEDAGRTVSALEGRVIHEALLQGVKLARLRIGETLNGHDAPAVALDRERHAGENGPPVEQHCAHTAGPMIARDLRPLETKDVPKCARERVGRIHVRRWGSDGKGVAPTVDRELHFCMVLHPAPPGLHPRLPRRLLACDTSAVDREAHCITGENENVAVAVNGVGVGARCVQSGDRAPLTYPPPPCAR